MKTERLRDSEDRITEAAVAGSAVKLVPEGSVLFVVRSGILRHTLPAAFTDVPVTVNQDLRALTPREGIDAWYVLRYIQAENRAILDSCVKDGTTVQSIEFNRLAAYPLPVPPLAEQRRIVAKLDALLSEIEAGEAALDAAEVALKRYRQSVLAAAVEGRLTEAWRRELGTPAEPGADLLDRILAERRATWERETLAKYEAKGQAPPKNWQARYAAPVAPSTDELPELPEGWTWATVDQVCFVAGGITKNKGAAPDNAREVSYLRVANVQRGALDLGEVKTILAAEDEIEALRLRIGDVLFNEGGDRDKLGRGWIWQGELPECIHQNHVFRARPVLHNMDFSKLLSHYGNTKGQAYFIRFGRQTTNLASISMSMLRGLPVPVAPADEQGTIIAEVERLLSLADVAAEAIRTERARSNALRQSVLREAFAGRLVPQNADDELATVLLERIREAHAQAPQGNRAHRRASQATLF